MMVFECCYDIAWIGLFHDVSLGSMRMITEGADMCQWPTYTPNEVACSIGMFSLFGSLATWVIVEWSIEWTPC